MAASPLSLWCLWILLYSRSTAQRNPALLEAVMRALVQLVKGSPLVPSATLWFLLHIVKHKSYNHKDLLSVGNMTILHCWRQLPVAVQRLELLPRCRKLLSSHLVVPGGAQRQTAQTAVFWGCACFLFIFFSSHHEDVTDDSKHLAHVL